MKVLVVEDEAALRKTLVHGLEDHGMRVTGVGTFAGAVIAAAEGTFDVLVLDVLLPGGDGVELCRRLRADAVDTPVLFLTALGEEDDRLAGFRAGGDDYLVKPFSFRELVARIEALGRRSKTLTGGPEQIADLKVDLQSHRVERAGRTLTLTAQEWALLECLLRRRGQVVTRAELTAYVWDENHDPFGNLLEVLVWRLRKKIDGGSDVPLIHTVRGAGYRLGS